MGKGVILICVILAYWAGHTKSAFYYGEFLKCPSYHASGLGWSMFFDHDKRTCVKINTENDKPVWVRGE